MIRTGYLAGGGAMLQAGIAGPPDQPGGGKGARRQGRDPGKTRGSREARKRKTVEPAAENSENFENSEKNSESTQFAFSESTELTPAESPEAHRKCAIGKTTTRRSGR